MTTNVCELTVERWMMLTFDFMWEQAEWAPFLHCITKKGTQASVAPGLLDFQWVVSMINRGRSQSSIILKVWKKLLISTNWVRQRTTTIKSLKQRHTFTGACYYVCSLTRHNAPSMWDMQLIGEQQMRLIHLETETWKVSQTERGSCTGSCTKLWV